MQAISCILRILMKSICKIITYFSKRRSKACYDCWLLINVAIEVHVNQTSVVLRLPVKLYEQIV